MTSPFLTARWESLALLNYRCPHDLLTPAVPAGTELDEWRGECLISLVGFLFRDTRVHGCRIAGHHTFEEVNLRFYVRREVGDELRRGVVFLRELVPKRAIAAVARAVYNEPYLALPMSHDVELDALKGGRVQYQWRHRGTAHLLEASADGPAADLVSGSEAEFITEHYWGYNRRRNGETLEYRVEHPPWRVWECEAGSYSGDAGALYGAGFGDVLASAPVSVHLAVGSAVSVFPGRAVGTV